MQAAGGEILCDEPTYRSAKDSIRFEVREPIQVKGKASPVPVYRPLGRVASPASRSNGPRRSFGRFRERIGLAGRLDALGRGIGGRVLVEADDGTGKTQLIADLAALAGPKGVNLLIGAGDVIEGAVPYHGWRPVFAQLLGCEGGEAVDAGTLLVPSELRRFLPLLNAILPINLPEDELTLQMTGRVRADNLNALLISMLEDAARQGPLAVVLEDVHWLDSASWTLATLAASRVDPLLLILTRRPSGDDGPTPRPEPIPLDDFQRVTLGPLSPEDISRLALDRLGASRLDPSVRALVLDTARGHPYFAEEIVYKLRDSCMILIDGEGLARFADGLDPQAVALPDNLRAIIAGRIDRLSLTQQVTLKTASVIGQWFPCKLLNDVHPSGDHGPQIAEDLANLLRQEMTLVHSPEPEAWHAIKTITIREVCYNSMLFARRRDLHRAVAAWLERTSEEAGRSAELLAYHWGRAEEWPRQMEYLARAGTLALKGGSNAEAHRAMTEALGLHERLLGESSALDEFERTRRAGWGRRLGEAAYRLGRLTEARESLERALDVLGRPVPTTPARTIWDVASQVAIQVGYRLGLARGAPLREGPPDEESAPGIIAALCLERLSIIRYFTCEITPGLDLALQALNAAEREGDTASLARSSSGMCVVLGLLGLHRPAEAYSKRSEALVSRLDHLPTSSYVLMAISMYRLGAGRWEEVREGAERCAAISRRLGDQPRLAEALTILAMLACFRSEYEESGATFAEVEAIGGRSENRLHQAWGACGRGEVAYRLGRLGASTKALDEALALLRGETDHTEEIRAHGLRAAALWDGGEPEAALSSAEEAARLAAQFPTHTCSAMEGNACSAMVFLRSWEAGRRPRELRRAISLSLVRMAKQAKAFPIAGPRAWLLRGIAARQFDGQGRALACWRKALRLAGRLGMPLEEGLAHLELGRHASPPDRRPHLAAAVAIFDRLGVPIERARAESALRDLGD